MNNSAKIGSKIVGSEKAKQRRAELFADLSQDFAVGGSQAVTDRMTSQIDALADSFFHQLEELKKQL